MALLVALLVFGSGTFLAPRLVGASTTAGAVYAWFDNDAGQFCNGTVTVTGSNHDSKTPVPTRLPAASAVAAGQSHTLAVDANGAVYGCGFNGSGQLGNATGKNSSTPVRAALPTHIVVTAVAAGWKTSLALTSTGAVYAWGLNTYGQIGDGSTSNRSTPVLVHLPAGVVVTAIAAGQYHCLAVTSTGAVYAWGYNGFGQLGNGGTTRSSVPVRVSLPAGVVAASVGAGDNHSLVVTSTGSIYAFGQNSFGQLGTGTTTQSNVPVAVSLPTGVVATQVAAGGISLTAQVPEGDYSLAVTTTGTVYAWGADAQGQLGNNRTTNSSIPVVTQLPSGAIAIAVGAGPNFGHALTTNGNIYSEIFKFDGLRYEKAGSNNSR